MKTNSEMDVQKSVKSLKDDLIIIDIPSSSQSSASSSPSSSSSSSSSYDTDSSSVISKTYCSKHQEYLYMEKSLKSPNSNFAPSPSLPYKANSKHDNTDNTEFVYVKANNTKDWPIFIVLISTIEIIVFMYYAASFKRTSFSSLVSSASTLKLHDLPMVISADSLLIYRPDRRLEIWRFISYMFLHANWFHLGYNVIIQLFYGIPLEVMHGSVRIMIIYFAGVFSGSLGTSVIDSEVYLVGASGGVYALLTAHLANIILNYGKIKYPIAQLISVLVFVLCDLAYAFYTQYAMIGDGDGGEQHEAPPVSHVAHVTGGLAGLTMGILMLKVFKHRPYENHIWWLSLGIYCAFTSFAVIFNLINSITAQLMEEKSEAITQHLLHDLGVS